MSNSLLPPPAFSGKLLSFLGLLDLVLLLLHRSLAILQHHTHLHSHLAALRHILLHRPLFQIHNLSLLRHTLWHYSKQSHLFDFIANNHHETHLHPPE